MLIETAAADPLSSNLHEPLAALMTAIGTWKESAQRALLRAGPVPAKPPTLDKLLDILVSRLAGAVEALRQMYVAEGRPLPERYSHLKPPRKAQQQQQLMLLMVNDADRAGHLRGAGGAAGAAGQTRPGQAGSGLVSGVSQPGLVNQGGDDRSAAGLAIQHTFGGVSLTSKATKSRPAAGGRAGATKAGLAGAKRANNSGAMPAGANPAAAAAAAGGVAGPSSSSSSRQQHQPQDMGVSAAGRQRKRKALYAGDGQEWVVPPVTGVKDELQQVPVPPHVLPQHHPHHQIRRGGGGDSSGSLGQLSAAAAAAGHAGGLQDPPGLDFPAQQQQHVQQYPQQRGEGSTSESDGTVYCMCLQAHDQDYFISCDRCGDWCHVKCVGMTIAAARAAKSWCCPLCWAVSGDTAALAATSERLAKVRGW
jgi:hypothetical protein